MNKREALLWLALFLLSIGIAFLLRETPKVELKAFPPHQTTPKQAPSNQTPNRVRKEPPKHQNTTHPSGKVNIKAHPAKVYSSLEQRNPFSFEGSYSGIKFPDEPYRLVSVKLGNSPEAILRFFTGELIKVKVGDRLKDNSKVIAIKENRVTLERLGKRRDLIMFKVEVDKWKPKRPFGSLHHLLSS